MNEVKKISKDLPACYGVCCPHHSTCQRYDNADKAEQGVFIIYTCSNFIDDTYPLYLEKEE